MFIRARLSQSSWRMIAAVLPAWSRALLCDGRNLELAWSDEARGMWWAMPIVVVIFVWMATITVRVS